MVAGTDCKSAREDINPCPHPCDLPVTWYPAVAAQEVACQDNKIVFRCDRGHPVEPRPMEVKIRDVKHAHGAVNSWETIPHLKVTTPIDILATAAQG